jgi:DNA-binding winged helix-turn-helix (wHTH) protein
MRYRFGAFVFDPATRQLARDAAALALTPKAGRLLGALLAGAPDPITRDALYELLWPGTFVEAGNLHNLISELRRVLGDDEHTIIRTVHGSGYALTETVKSESNARFRVVIGETAIELRDGETIVGRDDTGTPDVSRRHARIVIDGDRATIEDLGSKNGTVLRDVRIQRAEALHDGDEIVLGRTRARFEATQETTLTITPPSGL